MRRLPPCEYCDMGSVVSVHDKRLRRAVRLCARHVSPTARLTRRQQAIVAAQQGARANGSRRGA